jgi:hypothetical protein
MSLQDFTLTTPKGLCTATGQPLLPGDEFVSALFEVGDRLERRDFARDAWGEPPEACIGWWLCRVPSATTKPTETPREVMLRLLAKWQQEATQLDRTYVLALWLVRRRVLRFDETPFDNEPENMLRLFCPSNQATYEIVICQPNSVRQDEIQAELNQLIYGDAA